MPLGSRECEEEGWEEEEEEEGKREQGEGSSSINRNRTLSIIIFIGLTTVELRPNSAGHHTSSTVCC